jgi:hypothetical protein
MSGDRNVFVNFIARVTALLPEDWRGSAGDRFREGAKAVSEFANRNGLLPENLLEEGIELGIRKLTGLATQEHSAAEKNYAEAARVAMENEELKIEIELKNRALQSDFQRRQAEALKAIEDARKASADADLAELKAIDAQLELSKKLEGAGMSLYRDKKGKLALLSKQRVLGD